MKIAITSGDINGVSSEVLIKCLSNKDVLQYFTPVLYNSAKVLSYHKNTVDVAGFDYHKVNDARSVRANKINLINCSNEVMNINLGTASEEAGKFAQLTLQQACQDLKDGLVDALVTLPINKQAMQMASFQFPGHTEFLEHFFHKKGLMMMVSDDLKIALVTNHLPISQVSDSITKELIDKKLQAVHQSLMVDFGIERPMIAVLGLNPHAGDNGALGSEDDEIIRPAIIEAKKKGIMVAGPFSADGFFGSSGFKKYDCILAMYHDQGLIPFKSLSFGSGVNFTAGLNIVRTSPDHGTAFDIAGKNEANESSVRKAIFTALDIARNRSEYISSRENKLDKVRPADLDGEDEIINDSEY
jgi:4-phospho-D-threonate 3-dehydrogenase / 4-phospho-D-erythronate 3-dehydrogenase